MRAQPTLGVILGHTCLLRHVHSPASLPPPIAPVVMAPTDAAWDCLYEDLQRRLGITFHNKNLYIRVCGSSLSRGI